MSGYPGHLFAMGFAHKYHARRVLFSLQKPAVSPWKTLAFAVHLASSLLD